MIELLQATEKNVPLFSFNDHMSAAKIVKVLDGDTVHIVCYDRHGDITKMNIRLSGIDTPEIKTTPFIACKARNYLISIATDVVVSIDDYRSSKELQTLVDENKRIVYVKILGDDKYGGRYLAQLYQDSNMKISINEMMVSSGYARSYDGGAKQPWIV